MDDNASKKAGGLLPTQLFAVGTTSRQRGQIRDEVGRATEGRGPGGLSILNPSGTVLRATGASDRAVGIADDPVDLLGKKKRHAARVAEAAARARIKEQQQAESLRLARAKSDVAERTALSTTGQGGRSLLIATSPTGTRSTNLGGTA